MASSSSPAEDVCLQMKETVKNMLKSLECPIWYVYVCAYDVILFLSIKEVLYRIKSRNYRSTLSNQMFPSVLQVGGNLQFLSRLCT